MATAQEFVKGPHRAAGKPAVLRLRAAGTLRRRRTPAADALAHADRAFSPHARQSHAANSVQTVREERELNEDVEARSVEQRFGCIVVRHELHVRDESEEVHMRTTQLIVHTVHTVVIGEVAIADAQCVVKLQRGAVKYFRAPHWRRLATRKRPPRP